MNTEMANINAELIKADTALKSFRDAGYNLEDAIAESIDNSIEAGATEVRIDWVSENIQIGKSKKKNTRVTAFAIADNGDGIPANLLPSILTVGFSTRYGSRNNIGRFGVGFKLGAISQARKLEVYTCPAYLEATEEKQDDGSSKWIRSEENKDARIFMSSLDIVKICDGEQSCYELTEVESYPQEFAHLMGNGDRKYGTLVVWRDLDRLNHIEKYAKKVDEKIAAVPQFLRRTYRVYVDRGLKIYFGKDDNKNDKHLFPYDPTFQIDNEEANSLVSDKYIKEHKKDRSEVMKGIEIEKGVIPIEGHEVGWGVYLTPEVTRLESGGGGTKGPEDKNQFKKLWIPDNAGKLSFLRHEREISYTKVPWMLPSDTSGKEKIDRYIGIEVSFPPALDEYFQVKHVKRGAEPIDKLRKDLRETLKKPIEKARKDVRALWAKTKKQKKNEEPSNDISGGRDQVQDVVKAAGPGMPPGRAGNTVSTEKTNEKLKIAAKDAGITDEKKQKEFVESSSKQSMVTLDMDWPGKELVDIDHLNGTVLVRINRRHPLIQKVYLPLQEAISKGVDNLDEHAIQNLLETAKDGIDLLIYAYAKAENQSRNPEDDYGELRADWGKFAAVYINKRDQVRVD